MCILDIISLLASEIHVHVYCVVDVSFSLVRQPLETVHKLNLVGILNNF